MRARCPNGTRKNKKTGNCEPSGKSRSLSPKKRSRCPNGTHKNKKTGKCVSSVKNAVKTKKNEMKKEKKENSKLKSNSNKNNKKKMSNTNEENIIATIIVYNYGKAVFSLSNQDIKIIPEMTQTSKYNIYEGQIYNNKPISTNKQLYYLYKKSDPNLEPIVPVFFTSASDYNKYVKENKDELKQFGEKWKDYFVEILINQDRYVKLKKP